jgi:hypothetical protein
VWFLRSIPRDLRRLTHECGRRVGEIASECWWSVGGYAIMPGEVR